MPLKMIRPLLPLTAVAALALASLAVPAAAQPQWRFDGVERVVAIADIHGAYPAFERILGRTGLIDAERAWIGGRSNLLIVGDVLDRGPESRKALDLIIALEPQALAAGGRVHLVLGNHEVMNLIGDLRYVTAGEYAAFAGDESASEREAGFARFRTRLGDVSDELEARQRFERDYPPGYFAHRRAFARDGQYGAWLLEHPFLIVIDGTAFVHAGLAAAVIASGDSLNAELDRDLNDYLDTLAALTTAGILSPLDDLYAQVERTASLPDNADARHLLELQTRLLMSPDGPIWYRGNEGCSRLTEFDRLQTALAGLGARRVVVGHTPTRNAYVLSRMDSTILRVDTGMLTDFFGGRASALIIENGELSAMYEDEAGASPPVEQPRHVGLRPDGLSDEALESLLGEAAVTSRRDIGPTARLLTLRDGSVEIEGLFLPSADSDILPAVAAYRLDRLLELDLVPVTVRRELDGVSGSLQFWPARTLSETDRADQGLGGGAWCPLNDQFADMIRFDSLIFNRARTIDRIRYSSEGLQLLLIGNELSFTTDSGRPDYLEGIPVELTPAWRAALSRLDVDSLSQALADVLDPPRIRALLERRNFLLDAAER